jgi:hypothetical protein
MQNDIVPEQATHRVEITVYIESPSDKEAYELAESILNTVSLIHGVIKAEPNKTE